MYLMLTVQAAHDPDDPEPYPLLHTADQQFVNLVLRLAARRLRRAASNPAAGERALILMPGTDEGSE